MYISGEEIAQREFYNFHQESLEGGASRLSSSHLQLPRNCEIPARQIDTDFSKTNPTFEKTCFYALFETHNGRNRNNSLVKNNLNRRNPTYVTTLQNTHLRAHVTRHDWQQRILPIL